MRSLLLAVTALLVGAALAYAVDKHEYIFPAYGTAPVAIYAGDTPSTYSVNVASDVAGAATLIKAAVINRTRRRLCMQNTGSTTVSIGSSPVTGSNLWVLGESTNTAIIPIYCTNNTGAFYGSALANSLPDTVRVMEEDAASP